MTLTLTRRHFSLGGLALLLASCGGGETAARAAFIAFLQERVVQPRHLSVPRLSEEEKRRFGPYAGHYAPIRDFHDTLARDVAPLTSSAARILPALRRPHDWIAHRAEVTESRRLMGLARTAAQDLFTRTTQAVAGLSQPEDLKPVYAAAYAKAVGHVMPAFTAFLDGLDDLFSAVDQAGAYIDGNLGRMRVVGGLFETGDASILAGLQERSSAIAGAQSRLFEVRRRLDSLIGGA